MSDRLTVTFPSAARVCAAAGGRTDRRLPSQPQRVTARGPVCLCAGAGGGGGSLVRVDTLDDVEEDVFYFDPAPVDQDVREGGEARLRCDVSSRRMIVFYWTLDGKPVANTSRRYQDDSDLRVVRADRRADAGSFRCVATNVSTGIALRSAEARLNVLCEYSVFS